MNPNATKYRVRPCIVCQFPFSDEHHIHPEILGRDQSPTIILCPNHHRVAHILQGIVANDPMRTEVIEFAHATFDASFNMIALPLLLNTHDGLLEKRQQLPPVSLEYSEGDVVEIRAGANSALRPVDGYWGVITHVGTWSCSVHVSLKGEKFQCKGDELSKTDNCAEELRSVSERIAALIKLELEPVDYAILETLQKSYYLTPRQILFLERIEEDYALSLQLSKRSC